MTADPYAMALFQSLGNAASSVGSGLFGQLQNDVLQKRGATALLEWLDDPSPQNFTKASRYGTLQDFLSMMQTVSALDKQEAETGILQQQRLQLEDLNDAVLELASAMGVSPGLAQLMLSNPDLLNKLSGQVESLAHLEPEERKAYFEDVQGIRNDLESASLAHRLAVYGDATYLDELHRLRPVNENRLKRLRGRKEEARDHGLNEVRTILGDMARKRVISRLSESRNLTRDQRLALETQIFASPEYRDLVSGVSQELLTSANEFNPGLMLEAVDRFVDQHSGFDRFLAGEERPSIPEQGKVELGREFRPRGGSPSSPKSDLGKPVPSSNPSVSTGVREVVERQPIEDEVVSFKGSFKKFNERAKKNPATSRMSDEDLRDAYDNHQLLSQIRKTVRWGPKQWAVMLDTSPEVQNLATELGLNPGRNELKNLTKEQRKDLKQRAVKQVALESAMIEEMFHLGTPPSVARGIARETLESLPDGVLPSLLDQMQSKNDLIEVMDFVSGEGSGIAEALGGAEGMKSLPEELSVSVGEIIRDTLAVGGIRGLASTGDALFWASVFASLSATTGIGAVPLMLGIASVYGVAGVYADRRNLQQDRYYKAFFLEPRTKTQQGRYVVERRKFAEEFAHEFTPEERKQLINGTYTDMAKVKNLIYDKAIMDHLVEFLNSPVGYADRRSLNVINRTEEAFPNYNERAVRGAELFGSLTGLGASGRVLGAGAKPIKGARPDVLEMNPTFRSRIASARARTIRKFRGSRPVSHEKTAFDNLFERWATDSGTVSYAPYSQQGRLLSFSNDLTRRAAIVGLYEGFDYWLDQAFDDADFYRRLLWTASNIGGGLAEGQYYRIRSKAFDINSQWQERQFEQFGKDFGGGSTTKFRGKPSPKNPKGGGGYSYKTTVIDAPNANKQVTYKPGGIIEVNPSPSSPKNIPEGPVSRQEFTKPLSSNLMSLQGLSKTLKIHVPDFARAEASSVVNIDMDAMERFVRDGWVKKEEAIELARRIDLSDLVPTANIRDEFGAKYVGQVPKTNDLQLLATKAYDNVYDILGGVDTKPIVKDLNNRLEQILDYFESQPTLGAQSAKKLAETVRATIHHRDFQASSIMDYHKKINKERRALNEALEKEYSPDKSQLLEFYNALDHAIRNTLPEDARYALEVADNIYRAYKFSQSIDRFLDEAMFDNIDSWAGKSNKFKDIAGQIYDELKDSHTADVLRRSFLHDEYIRDAMTRKNISWSRAGEVFRKGQAIDSIADFRDAAIAVQRTLPFGKSGAGGRFASHVLGKAGRLRDQQIGEQAVMSTPHYQSKEYKSIVDSYEKAHKLRATKMPLSRSQEEPPLIVKKIDEYLKREQQRAHKQGIKNYQEHKDKIVSALGRRLLVIEESFDTLGDNVKQQAELIREVEEMIPLLQSIRRGASEDVMKRIKELWPKVREFLNEHSEDVLRRLKEQKKKDHGQTGLYPRKSLADSIRDIQKEPPQTFQEIFEQTSSKPATPLSPGERLKQVEQRIQLLQKYTPNLSSSEGVQTVQAIINAVAREIDSLSSLLNPEDASRLVALRKQLTDLQKQLPQ